MPTPEPPPISSPRPNVTGSITILVGSSWLLFLAIDVIPWFGLASAAVVLVPMVVAGLRHSLAPVMAGATVCAALTLVFFGVPALFFYTLSVWGPAAIMLVTMQQRWSLPRIIVNTAAGPIVAGMLGPLWALWQGEGSSREALESAIRQQVEETMILYRTIGMPEEDVSALLSHLDDVVAVLLTFSPSMLVCAVLSVIVVNYAVVRRLVVKGLAGPAPREDERMVPPLSRWRLHDGWVWALIGLLVLLMLPVPFTIVWLNLFVFLAFLYLLQGLAVLGCWCDARRVPRWLQYAAVALMAFQPLLVIAVVVIGIADVWIDSRRLVAPQMDG